MGRPPRINFDWLQAMPARRIRCKQDTKLTCHFILRIGAYGYRLDRVLLTAKLLGMIPDMEPREPQARRRHDFFRLLVSVRLGELVLLSALVDFRHVQNWSTHGMDSGVELV